MKTIDKFYSRFGEDVKGVVYAKAKEDGDIKHLLVHLGLPVSGVIDRQHRILVDFIHTNGKSLFIKAASLSGGAIAVKKLLQDAEMQKIKDRRERMRLAQLQGLALRGTPVVERRLVTEAELPKEILADTTLIHTETYSGPERRQNAERRVGPRDRRVSMELITFKNRRFGPKRRKGPRREGER